MIVLTTESQSHREIGFRLMLHSKDQVSQFCE